MEKSSHSVCKAIRFIVDSWLWYKGPLPKYVLDRSQIYINTMYSIAPSRDTRMLQSTPTPAANIIYTVSTHP